MDHIKKYLIKIIVMYQREHLYFKYRKLCFDGIAYIITVVVNEVVNYYYNTIMKLLLYVILYHRWFC